ncbi:MAG: SDR family NAD(P)-dependent oxidoreductase [Thermoleophilaceae bacterium]
MLVTGGAGFIGSHLVELLLEHGNEVRVLDSLDPLAHPSGRPPGHLLVEADLVVGDVRDRGAVDAALDGVEEVFHLAGSVGNGESMVNVRRTVDANSVGTATLLEAILSRRDSVRRLVLASSMVVYGEGAYRCALHGRVSATPRSLEQLRSRDWEPRCPRCLAALAPVPVGEDEPLRPTSVYGITKRDQEELGLVLGRAYGLEVVALRYLNVYGPRQALANPYTGVAAIFAARLLAGRPPLVFEDGHQIRDLVHVADVVAATSAAMRTPEAAGLAINVSSGRRLEIGELAGRIGAALGSSIRPAMTGEFRVGDIRHCFADTARAERVLAFRPAVDLDVGIAALAEWVARQTVDESGDRAVAALRGLGLVG